MKSSGMCGGSAMACVIRYSGWLWCKYSTDMASEGVLGN